MEDAWAFVLILAAAITWWLVQFLAWRLILQRGGDCSRARRLLLVFGIAAPVFVLLVLGAGDVLDRRKIETETVIMSAVVGLVVFLSWLGLITASKIKQSHR